MSGLREKIADAIAGAVSQDDRYLEHADAVLRVLAEHGDMQQVREQLVSSGALVLPRGDRIVAVMAVVARIVAARDAAVAASFRDYTCRTYTETVEADVAAAQQQLDQVRELAEELSRLSQRYGNEFVGYPEANTFNNAKRDAYDYASDRLLHILDAPARPAGHDESGQ